MTNYTLSKTIEEGITRLVEGCVRDAVEKLADKYELNVKEAMALVGCVSRVDKEIKTRKTQVKAKPTIPLPYCDKIFEDKCFGIRINHGLHTQCTQERCEGSDYCKTCDKQSKQSETNKPNAGDIRDRSMGNWTPCSKLVKYGNVMEKLGISREEAEKVATEYDMVIPEHEFEIVKGRRGRPKKDTSTCSSDDENTTTTKRGRGRPKKTKTVISTSSGDDLIAQLVSAANAETICEETDSDSDAITTKETAAAAAKAEKEAAKAAAKAEKEAAKAAAKADKEAAKAAAKAEKEAAKEKEQQETTEPRPTLVAVAEKVETETLAPRLTSMTLEDSEGELEEDEMSGSDDDEAEVIPKNINGEDYLIDNDTNEVYDANTHELIGVWDKDNDKIITCDDM